jgi:hypothetical protein
MRSLLPLTLAALLGLHGATVAAKPSAECGPPPDGAICADGPWFSFAWLTADITQGPSRSRYEVVLGAGRDLKVRVDENNPNYRGKADALLIDGNVFVYKREGVLPAEGQDLLSDPFLAAQEAATLLQLALPKGPATVTKKTPVRVAGKRFIVANTPAMSAYYAPPWKVEGSIEPFGNETYAYELTFTFRTGSPSGTVGDRDQVRRYSGRVSYPKERPRIPDSTSLKGWSVDVPGAQGAGFDTLGEARRALGVEPR